MPLNRELTPRQLEIADFLAEGVTNKIMAYRMGLSEATVKVHVVNTMRILGASNRTEACAIVWKRRMAAVEEQVRGLEFDLRIQDRQQPGINGMRSYT